MEQGIQKTAVCPECGLVLEVNPEASRQVRCPCGRTFTLKPPGGLGGRAAMYGARARKVQQEEDESSPLTQFYYPLVLFIVGIALWIGQALFKPLGSSALAGAVMSLMLLVFSVIVMVVGVVIAAKMLSVNFGPGREAIFKLLATAICASAAFAFCASLDMPIRGPSVGWHVLVLIYAFSFKTMFDLDMHEALMTTGIVAILQALTALVLFAPMRS